MNITSYLQDRQYGLVTRKSKRFKYKQLEQFADEKTAESLVNKPCSVSGSCRSTFIMGFSPDGTKIASAHGDHTVRVTDIATGQCVRTLQGHPRTPWCLAYHPSSSHILASGCLGGQVRIWDLYGYGCEVWQTENSNVIASLTFHPTEHVLVIAAGNSIYFWDWGKPKPFAKCSTLHEYERIRWIQFDGLGHNLYTGISNNTAVHRDEVSSVSLSSQGQSTSPRQPSRLSSVYSRIMNYYQDYRRDRLAHETSGSGDEPEPSQPSFSSNSEEDLYPGVRDIDIVEPRSPSRFTVRPVRNPRLQRSAISTSSISDQIIQLSSNAQRNNEGRTAPSATDCLINPRNDPFLSPGPSQSIFVSSTASNVNPANSNTLPLSANPSLNARKDRFLRRRQASRDLIYDQSFSSVAASSSASLTTPTPSSVRPTVTPTTTSSSHLQDSLKALSESIRTSITSCSDVNPYLARYLKNQVSKKPSTSSSVTQPAKPFASIRDRLKTNIPLSSDSSDSIGAAASIPGGIPHVTILPASDSTNPVIIQSNSRSNPPHVSVVFSHQPQHGARPHENLSVTTVVGSNQQPSVSIQSKLDSAHTIPSVKTSNLDNTPQDASNNASSDSTNKVPNIPWTDSAFSSSRDFLPRSVSHVTTITPSTNSVSQASSFTSYHTTPSTNSVSQASSFTSFHTTPSTNSVGQASSFTSFHTTPSTNSVSQASSFTSFHTTPSTNGVSQASSFTSFHTTPSTNGVSQASSFTSYHTTPSTNSVSQASSFTSYHTTPSTNSVSQASSFTSFQRHREQWERRHRRMSRPYPARDIPGDMSIMGPYLESRGLANPLPTSASPDRVRSGWGRMGDTANPGTINTVIDNVLQGGEQALLEGEIAIMEGQMALRAGEWVIQEGERVLREGDRALRRRGTEILEDIEIQENEGVDTPQQPVDTPQQPVDTRQQPVGTPQPSTVTAVSTQDSSQIESAVSTSGNRSGCYFLPISDCSTTSAPLSNFNQTDGHEGLVTSQASGSLSNQNFVQTMANECLSTQIRVQTTTNECLSNQNNAQTHDDGANNQPIELVIDQNENYTAVRNANTVPASHVDNEVQVTSNDDNNNSLHFVPPQTTTTTTTTGNGSNPERDYLSLRNTFVSMTDQIEREMSDLNRRINALRDSFNQNLVSLRHDRQRYESVGGELNSTALSNNTGNVNSGVDRNYEVRDVPLIVTSETEQQSPENEELSDVEVSDTHGFMIQPPTLLETSLRSHRRRQNQLLQRPAPYSEASSEPQDWRQLQRHYLHPHYSSSIFDETINRPSNAIQSAINRAIAGAFMGTGESAVANNIINQTHRIQYWDFTKCDIPDITNSNKNIIVPHCKLHNSASCDIAKNGSLLATFVPSHHGFPDDNILAVYSILPENRGQCLYTKSFGPNAISISISPSSHYILVGLAAKKLSWVFTARQIVAQIYKLDQKEAGEKSTKLVKDIFHTCSSDVRTHVSGNSAAWLPVVGQGLVYGTNRGHLNICKPGVKTPVRKVGADLLEFVEEEEPERVGRFILRRVPWLTHTDLQRVSASTQTQGTRQTAATQTETEARTSQ